jgi:signal transduction histidine kinase
MLAPMAESRDARLARGLVEAPSEPVKLVTTRSTRILEADERCARLLKRPMSSLLQKPLAVLVELDERAAFRSRLALLPADGRVDDWHLKLSAPGGRPVGVVATVAAESGDSREGRLRWTLVLEQSPADHDQALADEGASHLDLERELGRLAHDLNQPLAAILTFVRGAQLRLRGGKLSDADLEAALETIAQEALRANAIARDLGQRWRVQ